LHFRDLLQNSKVAAVPLPFLPSQLVEPSAAHRYAMNSHTSVAELCFPSVQIKVLSNTLGQSS